MRVLKFGGSSVADADRITAVVNIVSEANAAGPVAVVVSALGGVTDSLVRAASLAVTSDWEYRARCSEIEERHRQAIAALTTDGERADLLAVLEDALRETSDLLRGISLVAECSARTLDRILSFGERLSSAVVAAALRRSGTDAITADAREFIVTDAKFGNARVDADATHNRIRDRFNRLEPIPVITGFIGATPTGEVTTLGRGGSDYTAAIVGAALDAAEIEIWTDVDGVLSADPKQVPGAFSLTSLSYAELMELSHFGAKVVYPPTVSPARRRSIPLRIRNTLNPAFPGTVITEAAGANSTTVRGISSVDHVALLRLEGDGMVGVPGIAARLFGALAREEISVIMISQGSSEHSICFALPRSAVTSAVSSLEREFHLERMAGLIDDVNVEDDVSIVAAIGVGMREQPGIAGKLFLALGERGINVRAIAQGSSELNISFVIDGVDEQRALNALHDTFFPSHGETEA